MFGWVLRVDLQQKGFLKTNIGSCSEGRNWLVSSKWWKALSLDLMWSHRQRRAELRIVHCWEVYKTILVVKSNSVIISLCINIVYPYKQISNDSYPISKLMKKKKYLSIYAKANLSSLIFLAMQKLENYMMSHFKA